MKWAGVAGVSAVLGLAALSGCREEVVTGQIMVELASEMPIPQSIASITIQVWFRGEQKISVPVEVGTGEGRLPLPARLAIVRPANSKEPVNIRVGAFDKAGDLRVAREVTTTVPPDRVAWLRIPLQWLCLDKVEAAKRDEIETKDKRIRSDCPADEDGQPLTCVSGECVSAKVNSADLPDYLKEELDKQGTAGSCFDVVKCFESGSEVFTVKDSEGRCAVNRPSVSKGKGPNLAVVLPANSVGFCSGERCLIPLNGFVQQGWEDQGMFLRLPEQICTLVEEKKIGVAVTVACKTKTTSVGACDFGNR